MHNLIPYLNFFCLENQYNREEFLKSLPQVCFIDLNIELDKIDEDYLRDWLADDINFKNKIDLWSALAILDQIPGEYLDEY